MSAINKLIPTFLLVAALGLPVGVISNVLRFEAGVWVAAFLLLGLPAAFALLLWKIWTDE